MQTNNASPYQKGSREGIQTLEKGSNTPYASPSYASSAYTESTATFETGTHNGTLVSLPIEKKVEPSSLENQTSIWAGYEQDILPEKTQGRFARNLRHQIAFLYRRIFGVVFLVNLGIFISVAVKPWDNPSPYIAKIVVGNLFTAILMRQEYVIDAFYFVFTATPLSWPLAIRRICARVYHIGGIHSGTGVSGTMWIILYAAQATREYVKGENTTAPTLGVTYAILALLVIILAFAYPSLRAKYHDSFEAVHRFLGWTAIGLVWAQVVLSANDWRGEEPLGRTLLHTPSLWMVSVMTLSLAMPWMRLKKVNVISERLSSHALRMYFDYDTPGSGSFVRISTSPWTEWHSFAAIPIPKQKGFSVIISKAGDWTIKQIADQPTKIWKRGLPTYGVMRTIFMFRRVVLVATGSGIAPCAPAIFENRIPIRLLWTAPNVRETFGDKLVDSLLAVVPDAVIYNTRQHGKPDMVKLTFRLVREYNAEAVFVISNVTVTEKVVYGMMSRGIPAFGAIWDS